MEVGKEAAVGSEIKFGYKYDERVLMLNGQYVKTDFPELYKVLKLHPKITKKNHEIIDRLDNDVAFLLQRSNGHLKNIIEISQKEWKASRYDDGHYFDEDDSKSYVCEVCGHKGLRTVYPIRNINTNCMLKVGRECIKKYVDFFDFTGAGRDAVLKMLQPEKTRNKLLLDFDQRTFNGLFSVRLAKYQWDTLPFLPQDPKQTQTIVQCINTLNDIINQVRTSNTTTQQVTIDHFVSTLNTLNNSLNFAKNQDMDSTTKWLISRDVYQWAKKHDGTKDNKSHQVLTTKLEERGRIDSTNIHLIHEASHVKKCIQLLQNSFLCRQFILEDKMSDNMKLQIYVIDRNKKYPFWITYGRLISEAAKLGFPDAESPDKEIPIRKALLEIESRVDISDPNIHDAEDYLIRKCQNAGIKIEYIDDDSNMVLIRKNNGTGGSVDFNLIIQHVSKDILGSDADCIKAILSSLAFYTMSPFKDAQKTWSGIYKHARKF